VVNIRISLWVPPGIPPRGCTSDLNWRCLGSLLRKQSRTEEAISAFEQTIKIAETLNDQNSLAIGFNCLGGLLQQQGRLEEAISAFEQSIKIAETLNDQNSLGILLNRLGGLLQKQERFEEAISAFERRIKIAETLNDQNSLAISLHHLGRTLRQQRYFPRSIAAFRRAIAVNNACGNTLQENKLLAVLAETLHEYGCVTTTGVSDGSEAGKMLSESSKIYEQLGNSFQTALALHSLGRFLKETNELEQAKSVLQRSRDLFSDLKDYKKLLMVLKTLGGIFKRTKEWTLASSVLKEGYDLAFIEKDTLSQAIISFSLGQLFAKQKGEENQTEARRYFLHSIKLGKEAEAPKHLVKVYTAWGQALNNAGKFEEAVHALSQAFEIDEQRRNIEGLRKITQNLTFALLRLGRKDDALDYCDRAIVATDNHRDLIDRRETCINFTLSPKPLPRLNQIR
jgi:tetratricopeptide (TPR) repeat protein